MNEFPFSGSDLEIKENPKSTTFAFGPGRSRIVGEGEMSVLIRNARWELTSLGPIDDWPQALIWAVNSMLESRFPASIFWGPEMLHFYNDAYLPLSSEKHPRLLGQPAAEAWSEAWHIIGPQFAAVLKDGLSIYQEKVLVPVTRGGRLQDVYWTYSYSPIRDEKSSICGILIVCHDVTGEMNAERERASVAASLQSVLGSITDGVFGLDGEWRYTYCNEQGAAIIGRRSNDLIGTSVWDQFPPAQVPEFEVGFRRAMESGSPVHFEEYYPAQQERWLECHCYPAQRGLTVYFRDITAKRKAAEHIQKSEERYRFISETAEVGYWDWNIVTDVLDWGPVCKRLFGIPPEEEMSYSRFLAALHPADRNRTDEAVRACLARATDYDIEYRAQWPDHSVHWIRAKGATRMCQGKVVRMAGIVIDISASKRNQEALERSERRLRLAQEAGHLAIWDWDLKTNEFIWQGDVVSVWGRGPEKIALLDHVLSYLVLEDRERFLVTVRRSIETKSEYDATFRVVWPDGSLQWIEAHGRVLCDEGGHIVCMLGTNVLVTERKRQEEALLNEQERLANFADTIPALAWMADKSGWIFWYNQRWFEYTGTTQEQMEGWGWQSVHDPVILPSVLERWKHSIDAGEPFEMLFPLRGRDGIFRSFMTRIFPMKDSTGEVSRWFGTNTEVDELERTRSELARERSRLDAVLNNVPVGLVFADASGKILGGNAEAERIFKHPVLLSARIASYGEWISYHPDGRLVLPEEYPLAQTLMDGCTHTGEYLYQRGDGQRAWVNFSSAPIRDAQGALTGAVVATLDINERKLAQDELREKNELVEIAQTAARAGVWQYYPATRTFSLSLGSQRLFELEGSGTVRFDDVLQRIYPADRDQFQLSFQTGLETGIYQSSFRVIGRGDEVCWISGQARVLENAQGQLYFVGLNLDVTRQRRAEEALRKSEKLAVAGRLAATISHEINNPLESVTNLLYIVRTSTNDQRILEHLRVAEEELARVTQIVTHSLRFHRASTAPTWERISETLESTAAIYKSRTSVNQIEIRPRYRDDAAVRCYSSELRQVFGNLIGNAFDAIRRGGIIYLRTRNATDPSSHQHGVRVTVADTGHGMDKQTVERLSEPFFTTKGNNGTGLGLWISYDILQKHQAIIRVRSRCKGNKTGTIFSIFFPLNGV